MSGGRIDAADGGGIHIRKITVGHGVAYAQVNIKISMGLKGRRRSRRLNGGPAIHVELVIGGLNASQGRTCPGRQRECSKFYLDHHCRSRCGWSGIHASKTDSQSM